MIVKIMTANSIPFAIVSFLYFNRIKNIPIFKTVPKIIILPNFPSYFKSFKPLKKV